MAKNKLFAMEELDSEGTEVEMEVSPEAGEVADVQVDVEQDVADVTEGTDAIEEGMGAADQLEEVETVVSDAVEEGEGLDPVAAEAIRIAVEAICARVGANPKSVYALYATENFQSASSRKANSKIALEGVGEFLKDMWAKIKAAVKSLWEKVKAFWDKHFSSLGRIRKAIDSTKANVSSSSGKIKDKAYIDEAPSFLVEAFAGKDDISATVVKNYINNHGAARVAVFKLLEMAANAKISTDPNAKSTAALIKSLNIKNEFTYGTKAQPLVGGNYTTIKIEIEAEDAGIDITTDREVIDNKETKLGLSIADKASLNDVMKYCNELIKELEKIKEKSSKMQTEFNKIMMDVEKFLNLVSEKGTDAAKNAVKEARSLVKVVYKLQTKAISVAPEVFANDIKVVKAAIGYVNVCLKNYK